MSFFHQIHNIGPDVDITLHIVRKNDNLTLEVIPGPRTNTKHVTLTGTPSELEDGFLGAILKKDEPQSGLNVQEISEPVGKDTAPAAKPGATKKAKETKAKDSGKIKGAPKVPKVKKGKPGKPAPLVVEQSMFDKSEEEPTNKELEQEEPETAEEETGNAETEGETNQ